MYSTIELLKLIHVYSLKYVYPNIEISLRIFLTILVTNAI